MKHYIDLDIVKKQFRYVENEDISMKITHAEPQHAKYLPFNTKFNENNLNFEGFMGDFMRKSLNKKSIKVEVNKLLEEVIKKISNIDKISIREKNRVKSFFEELYFEDGKLLCVHPKLAFWLEEGSNKEIAKFLVDIFLDVESKEKIEKIKNIDKIDQITTKLVIDSLEELKEVKEKSLYICALPYIKKIFKDDFLFIIKHEEVFLKEFQDFLKFYYFIYITQLTLKLNQFSNGNPDQFEEIYFNLNWEKASKTRIGYRKGWGLLESSSKGLFTHRNLLEILNCNTRSEKVSYWDLKEESIDNREELIDNLSKIINWYKSSIDIEVNLFDKMQNSDVSLEEKIKELYKVINYQFLESKTRKKPYEDYKKWIIEYGKNEFGKKRGPLGYTLNLTEDMIFLLTKLAIKDNDKIRLKNLFIEYEKRGVFLDKDSKERLEEFFEKLNLLEKKSDSGDAIYVKSIL